MTPVNKLALYGTPGAGKTTTAVNLLLHPLRHHANQTLLGHTPQPTGWDATPGGFVLEQVSPMLKAGMDRMSLKLFPEKTLPDAIGEKGELARFTWRGQRWELHSLPGEKVWTTEGGIDVPQMVDELKQFRVIILTFAAPLLSVALGSKYVCGLTEVFQLPQLGYGLTDAVTNAVELSLGLSKEGLSERYPREVRTLRDHDASTIYWNHASGKFDIKAVYRDTPVPPQAVAAALDSIVSGEHLRNLGGLLVRNILPFLNERVLISLTHVDLASQFLPRVVTADDWNGAFEYLWGGIDHTAAQRVKVPNVVMEFQPKPVAAGRRTPARRKAGTPAKPSKKSGAAVVTALDPTGAAGLWQSVHYLLANRRATKPTVESAPPVRPGVFDWLRRKPAVNGKR